MNKEIRQLSNDINIESRNVEGYACIYNSLSEDLGGFREIIVPEAILGVIEKSDVFALLNHDKEKGILARSKNGKGTLTLSIDEKGIKYQFEAPLTDLGNECVEMIKRGDIDSSSFAFTVAADKWEKQNDGSYIRTITQFEKLYDVSPVYTPAYSDTSVILKRFLDSENETEPINQENETEPIDQENETEPINQENEIEIPSITGETIDNVIEQENQREIKINNEIINNNSNKRQMENFRLISVLNKITNKRELTEYEQTVLNLGKSQLLRSGAPLSGSIQLPVEARADITATGAGAGIENIGEVKYSIAGPLRNNLVFTAAGAQVLSGLVGDVSLPSYAGTTVAWKGETVSATDGAGAFAEVILKPKRLTAYVNVSKQFLLQDSNDAESMLQRDIVDAVTQKLEETILGNAAGSATQPAGLFVNVTGTTVASYTGVTALEAALEDKNVRNYSFIVNNKAKFALKSAKINEGKMVYENNEIDGVPAFSTSSVYSKGIIAADWSNLCIGIWGIDLTIDEVTRAGEGEIRLIINAYVDAAFRRDAYSAINLA